MLDEFGARIFTPEEEEHIKRTEQMNRPRWPAVNKPKDTTGPEPARIVNDLDDNIPKTSAARLSAMLANNPKIQAAQSEWEKKNQRELESCNAWMHLTLASTITTFFYRIWSIYTETP
jgi:hypothetical protein